MMSKYGYSNACHMPFNIFPPPGNAYLFIYLFFYRGATPLHRSEGELKAL